MKYFTYQLRDNGDGSQSGPAGTLAPTDYTGIANNGAYYGCANLTSLASLTEFQAVEITEAEGVLAGLPAQPADYIGFIHWMADTFSVQTLLTLNAAYVSFPWFCLYGNAPGIQYCITDAQATAKLTAPEYALFQGAMTTFHLPVVLA